MIQPPPVGRPQVLAARLLRLTALAGVLVSRTAAAGTFSTTGAYSPDESAVATDDFEQPLPGDEQPLPDDEQPPPDGEPPPEEHPPDITIAEDPSALTGTHVLQIRQYAEGALELELPERDASYVARVWIKDGEVSAFAVVTYADESTPALSQLLPTGRVTTDGWLELESAPFSVEQARTPKFSVEFFAAAAAKLDALEVVPQGEFRESAACAGVPGENGCRADEMCIAHRCVDANGFVPPMPTESEKNALIDYLQNRIRFLFGPYENRKWHLPAALSELESARSVEQRYPFWSRMIAAVQRLSDSHSTSYGFYQMAYGQIPLTGSTPLNACFIGGAADVTPDDAPSSTEGLPDVLVSHAGQLGSWGLMTGDRLVAIDGMHPITWQRALIGKSWTSATVNDPGSPAQLIESLPGSLAQLAKTVTVIRCHGSTLCEAPVTLEVSKQKPPEGPIAYVDCDHRPFGHLAGLPDDHDVRGVFAGEVIESEPGERIHGVVWNSLYGAGSSIATALSDAVSSWKSKKARGVILDHRTGNGGTNDAAMPILGFATQPRWVHSSVWRSGAFEEGPKTASEGLALFEQYKNDASNFGHVGSLSASLDVPMALLITRDVSASDFFPHSLKGSPKARIFGPHPTNGAFSSFVGASYWFTLTYQLAAGDTLGPDGWPLTGHGVVPDEVVLPKQSDLLAGRDTVYEAALSWVRANLEPEGSNP